MCDASDPFADGQRPQGAQQRAASVQPRHYVELDGSSGLCSLGPLVAACSHDRCAVRLCGRAGCRGQGGREGALWFWLGVAACGQGRLAPSPRDGERAHADRRRRDDSSLHRRLGACVLC
eukprot:Amastigsp_a517274_6.p3 type:complete len:120 gc:universal Amastigsp_a517274_6:452-93(-)